MSSTVAAILQRVVDGQRLAFDEAVALFHSHDLLAIGRAADLVSKRMHPEPFRTFNIDRNINYTNVCNVYCKFCAFYRTEKDADAYVITLAEIDQKIEETLALGGTQILLQGGHHPKLTFQWYLDLLSHIKSKFPQINIHGFSPSEFVHFREVFQMPVEEIISQFVKAGLGSIPGGGAEILSDRVRQRVAPRKAMSDEWLGVMDTAHRLGLSTSATMMFGHVETLEDRIEHLERVRAQQDKSKGFTAFIAWTFQAENTRLEAPTVGGHEYLRMQALNRIYLDNFQNIQSSWVTQGPAIGQIALKYGANDLGSIMIEENVVSQAGTSYKLEVADMHRLICELGYEPHQRDNWYRLLN